MKTTITANAQLTVMPENELEEYALRQWEKDYIIGGKSILVIDNNILCKVEQPISGAQFTG